MKQLQRTDSSLMVLNLDHTQSLHYQFIKLQIHN